MRVPTEISLNIDSANYVIVNPSQRSGNFEMQETFANEQG